MAGPESNQHCLQDSFEYNAHMNRKCGPPATKPYLCLHKPDFMVSPLVPVSAGLSELKILAQLANKKAKFQCLTRHALHSDPPVGTGVPTFDDLRLWVAHYPYQGQVCPPSSIFADDGVPILADLGRPGSRLVSVELAGWVQTMSDFEFGQLGLDRLIGLSQSMCAYSARNA
ncbi:hypothetical protein B0H19DRAFT_1072392 [Mycena capillaripes]|nr:hypothetical protein B0H19DRAFT_1072392 [Mycena capillaripes]